VVWDKGIATKLAKIRNAYLPNETGGVILGYIDQKLHTIYVVDVLQAPPDSESSPAAFIRGVEGLAATMEEIARRTARVVGYIGEWHSHPEFMSAYPSATDRGLIATLASTLALDGQPALMMIVGSAGDISISVKSYAS
jgi:integrative and conjugative element protein (TIGR02256 family)